MDKRAYARVVGIPLAVISFLLLISYLASASPDIYAILAAILVAIFGSDLPKAGEVIFDAYSSIVLIVGMVVFLFLFERLKEAEKLKYLNQVPGGPVETDSGTRTYLGIQYQYFLRSRDDGFPLEFTVRIPCFAEGSFRLVSRPQAHKLFSNFGTSQRTYPTGDAEFDRNYYLFTETPNFAHTIFGVPNCRDTARRIFDLGYAAIEMSKGRLEARSGIFDTSDTPSSTLVTGVLPYLAELANYAGREVSNPITSLPASDSLNDRMRRMIVFPYYEPYVMAAAVIAGSMALIKAVDYWDDRLTGTAVGIVLAAAFWGLIFAGILKGAAKAFLKFEITTRHAYLAGYLMSVMPMLGLHIAFSMLTGEVDTYGLVTFMFGLFISIAAVPIVLMIMHFIHRSRLLGP